MNVRVVLVSAPVTMAERYGRFSSAGNTEPSFGLVCLAAAVRAAGGDVHIVEASSQNLPPEQAAEKVLAINPDVVGITATTVGITAAGRLAQILKLKRPELIILIGGCHATALPEGTLAEFHDFDLAVIGEGERTLAEIIATVDAQRDVPKGIDGTAHRDDGGAVVVNSPRQLIEDLDDLPLPAWSLLEGFPSAFRPSPARIKRWPCASVVLTRGCPNRCTFCDRSVFGNRCRAYSPARAVEIVEDLRRNYGVREILMEDDTFIMAKARMKEFCERLITGKVDVTWSCLGRADRVDPDLLKLMRKAGCWHISFGVESGDPEILRSVRKNLDLDQISRALTWCRSSGILTKGFFMVGFPGETRESMESTIRVACSLPLDDVTVMQLTPFPGSELYEVACEYGKFEKDWRRMNTLNTVFVPAGLTKEDMATAQARLLRSFYFRPGIILTKVMTLVRTPRLAVSMFQSLLALLRNVT